MRLLPLLFLLAFPFLALGEDSSDVPSDAPEGSPAVSADSTPSEPPPAAEITYRFEPRAEARAGWRFAQTSTWTVKGSNNVTVAGASVRKGPIDSLNSHRVDVSLVEVKDGRAHVIDVLVKEQVSREDGELAELSLDGLELRVAGPSGARIIERLDGKRLKRKQKKWLQRQFGGSPDGEDIDPVELLLRDDPIAPGESWDLSMDAIQGYFGEDRFTLDRDASHARATLVSVDVINGVDTGTFAFDVMIVPAAMRNAEFTEAAMTIEGTAHLPVQGDVPWFDYDVNTELRFLGSFKRGGIKANVDLTMNMHGVESRVTP
ncbi:MAG: hypothetical protein KDA24_19620 [Deltaproteobacteria bacterium]|nr:hypothetical protein [Deltaproteobacteria bacterium]